MRMKFLALMVLTLLAVLAVACGDDDDTGNDGGLPVDSVTAAPDGDGGGDGDGDFILVDISGFAFDPGTFTVPADEGASIQVTNQDSVAHTFTIYRDSEYTDVTDQDISIDAGGLGLVGTTFPAGEYFFRCDLHPAQMQGTFIAE